MTYIYTRIPFFASPVLFLWEGGAGDKNNVTTFSFLFCCWKTYDTTFIPACTAIKLNSKNKQENKCKTSKG